MNNEELDARSQYLVAAITYRLVSKEGADSIQLPEESRREQALFTEALKGPNITSGKAKVSLVLADLARELVAHGYQGGELTDESIKGAMTALRIMPDDQRDLQSNLHSSLRGWRVGD